MTADFIDAAQDLPASTNGTEPVVRMPIGDEVDDVGMQEYGLASRRVDAMRLPEDTREFADVTLARLD
jgi:hypothetical protein